LGKKSQSRKKALIKGFSKERSELQGGLGKKSKETRGFFFQNG